MFPIRRLREKVKASVKFLGVEVDVSPRDIRVYPSLTAGDHTPAFGQLSCREVVTIVEHIGLELGTWVG